MIVMIVFTLIAVLISTRTFKSIKLGNTELLKVLCAILACCIFIALSYLLQYVAGL
jgi:hypothetical protein